MSLFLSQKLSPLGYTSWQRPLKNSPLDPSFAFSLLPETCHRIWPSPSINYTSNRSMIIAYHSPTKIPTAHAQTPQLAEAGDENVPPVPWWSHEDPLRSGGPEVLTVTRNEFANRDPNLESQGTQQDGSDGTGWKQCETRQHRFAWCKRKARWLEKNIQ